MTAGPTTTHDDDDDDHRSGVIHDLYQRILQHAENSSSGVASLLLGLFLATGGLTYERNLQQRLTRPPIVLGQLPANSQIRHVYDILSATPDSILQRPLVPSLLVGTRAQLSSTAAFLKGGPSAQRRLYLRFREIITMIPDGAQIGVDWEVPLVLSGRARTTAGVASLDDTTTLRERQRREMIQTGPIDQPVVIILHGINNHSRFGYIQSLQRAFASRGWNACAMNFRGCGGVKMTTPRSYNAAYTGDLRSLVLQIAARMAKGVPIFLVGNSLGANVVTKYLGEEGLAKTLPSCVAGGISLGNPLLFYSHLIRFPFNVAMGQARKVTYLQQWHAIQPMNDAAFSSAKRRGMWSATLGQLDSAAAPVMIRADPHPPFGIKIGYESGGHEYWMDSGCYKARYVQSKCYYFINWTRPW